MTHNKVDLEMYLIKLLGLPAHVRSFDLHCEFGAVPTVKCEYEVWKDDCPVVEEGKLVTKNATFEIHLKEI